MKKSLWIPLMVVVLVGAVGGLRYVKSRGQAETLASTSSAAGPAAHAKATGPSGQATGTLTPLDLASTDVTRASMVNLSRAVELSGGLKAVNSALVKARVAGELRSLTVREGDTVKRGQVIGQIDTTEYDWRVRQADQQAQASRAQWDIAQRAFKNNKALVDQGFISSTALETSASNEAAAQANLQAANAAVQLARKARSDATLVAPIAGVVATRTAQPGERVPVEARIVEIVDLSRMELEAALPPQDAAELRVGQTAQLSVEGLSTPVTATVARISPTAQAGSRAVLAYLTLSPHPGLRQGLFARGSVAVEQRQVLAIPSSSVRNDQAQPTVPVLVQGVVTNRVVALGMRGLVRDEPMVEVLKGLVDGDTVLAGTVGVVRDATPVKLPPAQAAAPAAATTPATAPVTAKP
jgi:membrane fusion protein, multidrug efflux system